MKPVPIKIGDKLFASQREAARKLDLAHGVVYYHLERGTLDRLLLSPEERHPHRKPVSVDGVPYPSIAAAMRATGKTRHELRKVLKNATQ